MNIILEKAKEKDINEILALQKEIFYDDFIKYGLCPAYTETFEGLKDYLDKNQLIYLIKDNDKIIGDIIINTEDSKYYDLEVIGIKKSFQGKGIGKKVFELLEEKHNDRNWFLHTPCDKKENHIFYEKVGYENKGSRKITDKLTMTKFIKNIK